MAGKYLSLLVHFTWSTQNREPWIEHEIREDMYAYIGGIMRRKKAKLLAAGAVFQTNNEQLDMFRIRKCITPNQPLRRNSFLC